MAATSTVRRAGPVARRYARALFGAALEAKALAEVTADLQLFETVFADPALAALLADPRLDDRGKVAQIEKACGGRLQATTRALLGVLERRRRITLLLEIPAAFRDLDDVHAGRMRGEIETALPLADETRQRIERALSQRTGRQILLNARTVPALLGGVRVTFGGTRLDASASGRLELLRLRLSEAELR
jgi:F-type H+-transporting ATPase subunit delta